MIELKVPRDNRELLNAASKFFAAAASCAIAAGTKPLASQEGTEVPEKGACTDDAIADAISAANKVIPGASHAADNPSKEPTGGAFENASKPDEKGVMFDGAFCGVAKKPFYASGPTKGQWKRKGGVEEEAYNAWYAGALASAPAPAATTTEPAATNEAANAFGTTAAAAEGAPARPTNAGELIKWTSERTAAQHMTGDMLTQAYAQCNIMGTELFSKPEKVAEVYDVLISWGVPA